MNKKEVIEELMSKSREVTFGDDDNVYLSRKRTIELISQIDEPKKVVVPEFMDGYFRYCKDRGMSLFEAMKYAQNKEADWLTENEEVFSKAFFDGYEVKQDKEYVVTDGNKLFLKEFDELNAVIIIDDVVGAVDYAKRYEDKAKAQQAADDLGWKVVEVQ